MGVGLEPHSENWRGRGSHKQYAYNRTGTCWKRLLLRPSTSDLETVASILLFAPANPPFFLLLPLGHSRAPHVPVPVGRIV